MRLAIALAFSLAALPAWAGDRPLLAPTRDVAVTYRSGGPQGREARIAWLAAEQKLRVDVPGEPGAPAFILDNPARHMLTLVPERRGYLLSRAGREDRYETFSRAARFSREGIDRVAGHTCAVWRVEEPAEGPYGEPSIKHACITADGVTLRIVEGEGGRARATIAIEVVYGPQDPARFSVPVGWDSLRAQAPLRADPASAR